MDFHFYGLQNRITLILSSIVSAQSSWHLWRKCQSPPWWWMCWTFRACRDLWNVWLIFSGKFRKPLESTLREKDPHFPGTMVQPESTELSHNRLTSLVWHIYYRSLIGPAPFLFPGSTLSEMKTCWRSSATARTLPNCKSTSKRCLLAFPASCSMRTTRWCWASPPVRVKRFSTKRPSPSRSTPRSTSGWRWWRRKWGWRSPSCSPSLSQRSRPLTRAPPWTSASTSAGLIATRLALTALTDLQFGI